MRLPFRTVAFTLCSNSETQMAHGDAGSRGTIFQRAVHPPAVFLTSVDCTSLPMWLWETRSPRGHSRSPYWSQEDSQDFGLQVTAEINRPDCPPSRPASVLCPGLVFTARRLSWACEENLIFNLLSISKPEKKSCSSCKSTSHSSFPLTSQLSRRRKPSLGCGV